ncbi:hypothetical protein B0T11DRAFT_325266 [Plectosphaerella cucumerina]|uniref:Protein kinase domain-containing protein n=1 Tax=Plectosphaerella cucumerina TaxID=40658 RepID=A0A8K0TJY0_9PEZI|nr:hypothetical protein B0T11DRAFT_325266 [Plectosphaerella cucumerina]
MSVVQLYTRGIILPLRSHRPPEPFGKPDYKHPKTPSVKDLAPEDVSHLSYNEITFARHPRERHEPSIVPLPSWFPYNQTARVKIEYRLSCTSEGAQVVLCSVLEPDPDVWKKMGHACPKKVVAKIFDPLYYRNTHDMVDAADREYAQEAAAYIHLHGHRMDKNRTYLDKPDIVPGFFGTWTTDVTRAHLRKSFMSLKDKKKTKKKEAYERKLFDEAPKPARLFPHPFRPVRIILLEFIDGSPLSQFCDETVDHSGIHILRPMKPYEDEEKRLKIFHSIMDTMSRIGHMGIAHLNRQPSNFLIKHDSNRVVISDFSLSDVACYSNIGWQIQQKLPRPLHPISWGDIDTWTTFQGWFPAEWIDDVSLFDAWGEATFSHAEALKQVGRLPYVPGDPEYEEWLAEREPPPPIPEEWREWWDAPYPDKADIESPPTTHKASDPIAGSSVTPAEPTRESIDVTQWTNQQTPASHEGKNVMVNRGTDP